MPTHRKNEVFVRSSEISAPRLCCCSTHHPQGLLSARVGWLQFTYIIGMRCTTHSTSSAASTSMAGSSDRRSSNEGSCLEDTAGVAPSGLFHPRWPTLQAVLASSPTLRRHGSRACASISCPSCVDLGNSGCADSPLPTNWDRARSVDSHTTLYTQSTQMKERSTQKAAETYCETK